MEIYPVLSHSHIYWAVNRRSGSKDKFFTCLNLHKTIEHFFSLTTVQHWPSLSREVVQSLPLEVFQDPSEQSPAQPILASEHAMLEAKGWTRDFWHPIEPMFSYESINLGQLFWSDWANPWWRNWRREGRWRQITALEISSDSRTSEVGGDDLGTSAAAANTFSCWKVGGSHCWGLLWEKSLQKINSLSLGFRCTESTKAEQ